MGGYYARAAGLPDEVANACEAHYRPLGPSDEVPTEPASVAVALADKIDMLTGFWAIDEKPTGSRDPFGLRRAALGLIRTILDSAARIRLEPIFSEEIYFHRSSILSKDELLPRLQRESDASETFEEDLLGFLGIASSLAWPTQTPPRYREMPLYSISQMFLT